MAEIYVVKTFDQIYTAQKQYLIGKTSSLNNFNDGGRLNTILEAVALVSSEMQEDFFQALKKAIPTSVYNGWDFSKKAGTVSAGKITFSRSSSALEVFSIPTGTGILLDGIKYFTIESGSIEIGNQNSLEILSTSEIVGELTNISVNSINTISGFGSFLNQPAGIESAINTTAFSGGTEEESESERVSRFRDYVTSLAKAPVSGIISGVLSVNGIKSVTVAENSPSDGWVSIYADDGTGNLSSAKQTEIENLIKGVEGDFENYPGYKAAGIYVQVLPPNILYVSIESTVVVIDSSALTNTEAENIAITAIQNYTNSLKLGESWIKSEVITAIQNADPGIYDAVISVPATDQVAATSSQLIKTNTITITVSRT